MHPQNSTLLQDLPMMGGSSPELTNAVYSPILKPKYRLTCSEQSHRSSRANSRRSIYTDFSDSQNEEWRMHREQQQKDNPHNHKMSDKNHDGTDYLTDYDSGQEDDDDGTEEMPIWIGKDDVRYVSGVTEATTCNDIIAVLIQDELNNQKYKNVDGLRHEVDDYILVEKWHDVESKLDGDTKVLPLYQAWGDLHNEMRFRLKINKEKLRARLTETKAKGEKIERKKEKLSLVTKLMKRVLIQGEYIQKHISVLKDHNSPHRNQQRHRQRVSSRNHNQYPRHHHFRCSERPTRRQNGAYNRRLLFEQYSQRGSTTTINTSLPSSKCSSMEKLDCKCHQSLLIRNKCFQKSIDGKFTVKNKINIANRPRIEPKLLENVSLDLESDVHDIKTDDEMLLVIDNGKDNNESSETLIADNDSGNGKSSSFSFNSEDDTIKATPRRGLKSADTKRILREHNFNKKLLESLEHFNIEGSTSNLTDISNSNKSKTDRFESIRFEIMMKMSEMKQLLIREEMLLTKIQMKCAKYKADNELYNSRIGFDICIDELQKNLDECAREIVQNEQELFKTKLEVERKAKVLHDLKDLLEIQDGEEERLKEMIKLRERAKKQMEKIRQRAETEETSFVDNIHEFCDGNKTMVV